MRKLGFHSERTQGPFFFCFHIRTAPVRFSSQLPLIAFENWRGTEDPLLVVDVFLLVYFMVL